MHSIRLQGAIYYPKPFNDKINILSILIFSLTATFLFINILPAQAVETIIIVSSYAPNDLCGRPQLKGIIKALTTDELRGLKPLVFFLDSKRLPKREVTRRVDQVFETIKQKNPFLRITLDDVAFIDVAKKMVGKGPPFIVFSGVNRSLEEYNRDIGFMNDGVPTKNITGIYEHLFIKKQIELLDLILNRETKIAMLYSTDFMGLILKDQVERELKDTPYITRIELFPVSNMEELKKAISTISNRADIGAYIPLTMSVSEGDNKQRTIDELTPFITQHIKKIDLAINMAFTRSGFFGGVSVDFFNMGHQAGELAVQLLKGYPIKRLYIEKADRYKIVVNRKRMEELSVRLPDDLFHIVDTIIQ